MKLVILASRFPYPLEKGDKLRLYHQIKSLSKNHEIILIALNEQPVSVEQIEQIQPFCRDIHILPLRKGRIAVNLVSGVLRGMPLQVSYFYTPYLKSGLQNIIKSAAPQHIYCQLIRMAPYVADLPIAKTLDYQDAFSAGMERRAARAPFWLKWLLQVEAQRLQQQEELAAQQFDHCTIISEQDKKLLPVTNKNKISVIPNGVDIEFFQPNWSSNKAYDLVFVGNMGYHPNVEAAKFLVKAVLPLVQVKIPEVRVLIAGARPTAAIRALATEQVHVSGWLENILTAYQNAKLFVAPLFLGSGQQNKILEAMACGLPCITTPQVNNAIGASVNETIFVAEKAEEFANFAVRLLLNNALREQTGRQARLFVAENFSWQSAVEKLEKLF